jgi:hypothetical protein
MENNNPQDGARKNQLLWFTGAVGAAVGLAVWAYSRPKLSYWERTKRAGGQIAETAAGINPWLGAGTAALGCAALAYRLREPKSTWQRASERADQMLSQTAKQLRPWMGVIASAAISTASTAYNAKSRRRATNSVAGRAANAADRFADAGSRIWRRLQTISGETGKLYPRVRKMIA